MGRFKTDKSPGPDGFHPIVLKECAEHIAKPMALIFQASYDNSILPSDWKLAEVIPIFKKGPSKILVTTDPYPSPQ